MFRVLYKREGMYRCIYIYMFMGVTPIYAVLKIIMTMVNIRDLDLGEKLNPTLDFEELDVVEADVVDVKVASTVDCEEGSLVLFVLLVVALVSFEYGTSRAFSLPSANPNL